jgi:hypothetical protein
MAVTKVGELSRRESVGARSIIDEHEIVPGAVHFRKPKHHRPLTYAQLRSAFNVQRSTFGVWRLAFGVWRLAFGVWRLAFGVWRLAFGVWRLAFGVYFGVICEKSIQLIYLLFILDFYG